MSQNGTCRNGLAQDCTFTTQPGWLSHSPEQGQGQQGQPQVGDTTCPEENDLVFQRQVGEVGDALGPLNQSEELLVSSVADVGDRVICLTERGTKRKRAEEKRRIHQWKVFDNQN